LGIIGEFVWINSLCGKYAVKTLFKMGPFSDLGVGAKTDCSTIDSSGLPELQQK
jgi:hypothetical protein